MYDYEYDNENGLDDERNARRTDHRGPGGRPMGMVPVGQRRPRPRPSRAVYDGSSRPIYDGPARPREVVIYQEPPAQPRSGLFANLTTDEIVELVAQAFAAFQSLPGAPTATGDTKLDVENLITYQNALALHAKRDEQVRLIGSLAARLLSK